MALALDSRIKEAFVLSLAGANLKSMLQWRPGVGSSRWPFCMCLAPIGFSHPPAHHIEQVTTTTVAMDVR